MFYCSFFSYLCKVDLCQNWRSGTVELQHKYFLWALYDRLPWKMGLSFLWKAAHITEEKEMWAASSYHLGLDLFRLRFSCKTNMVKQWTSFYNNRVKWEHTLAVLSCGASSPVILAFKHVVDIKRKEERKIWSHFLPQNGNRKKNKKKPFREPILPQIKLQHRKVWSCPSR